MNYGYNKSTRNWNEKKKWILAEKISKDLNIPIETGNRSYKNDGSSPYIEVDGAYGGVRVRRITHLSEEEHFKLVKDSDNIYDEVMK